MEPSTIVATLALVSRDLGLSTTPAVDAEEESLISLLAERVAELLPDQHDLLFSLMYRLDIDEQKIQRALSPLAQEPAERGLARLIWERQKQRVITRRTYQSPPLEED